jgi:hypothetical protein
MPPYNGSGGFAVYTPGTPFVTGTTISSTVANNVNSDFATGLTNAITKDGQSTPTANIPLGGFKLTGVGAGTAATDAARISQLQIGAVSMLGTVAGTNTITGVLSPAITAYTSGLKFQFIAANTNTAATVMNINSVGNINLFANGAACIGGEVQQGYLYEVVSDGTQLHIVNPTMGKYIESVVSAVNFPTTTQYGDLTSIDLPPGDWDVTMQFFADFGGVTASEFTYGISQTTGNSATGLVLGSNREQVVQTAIQASWPGTIAGYQQSVTVTTTIYAKFKATYTVGTPNAYGRLSARRIK